jgi:hypothetical protein
MSLCSRANKAYFRPYLVYNIVASSARMYVKFSQDSRIFWGPHRTACLIPLLSGYSWISHDICLSKWLWAWDKGTWDIWGQFHQCSTPSFYMCRSRKHKISVKWSVSFYAFRIRARKSCTKKRWWNWHVKGYNKYIFSFEITLPWNIKLLFFTKNSFTLFKM